MERETLIQEYEETIHKQAALLKKQQSVIENLHEELSSQHGKAISSGKQHQDKVEILIQQVQSAALQENAEENYILKQELETALKEKDLCQSENKRQLLEIQRLRQEGCLLQTGSTDARQIPVSELKEYEKVIQALEEETQRLRSDIGKMEDEKMEVLKTNVIFKKKITSMEIEMERGQKEIFMLRSADSEKERTGMELKESFGNLQTQFADQGEDLRVLLLQMKALQKSKDHLSKIMMTVNERLEESRMRVSESVRIAEDALVEKDAALLREKHALDEVTRLESTISSLMEEAGEKAQTEMLKIKDDYNLNIKSISQEVVKFEMAFNEKQLECTKLLKEKTQLGRELDKLQLEFSRMKEKHQEEILNLNQRISFLDNRTAVLTAEKEDILLTISNNSKEQEQQRHELLARIQELENHLSVSRSDCEHFRIEYEELKSSYNSISDEFEKMEKVRISSEKLLKRQLRVKTEEIEELSSSSLMRLDAVNASHRDIVSQLNENLSALQESYSRLQTQTEDQKRGYEGKINEISQRLEDTLLKYKNSAQSTHEAKTELAVSNDLVSQFKNRTEELESRLHAAEHRFSTLKRTTFAGSNMNLS